MNTELWNEHIQNNEMLSNALEVIEIIEENGFESLIVGGSCRDLLLNQPCKDVDIAGNAPLETIQDIFPDTIFIGQSSDFNICVIQHKGFSYEYARYRQDLDYNGRKPDRVEHVQDFFEDAARRDLTINSMGMTRNGKIIDHFNARQDIENRQIKCVGCATERFQEDGLRIIRCVRFAAKLGFDIDSETSSAIRENLHMLDKVSSERIREELTKMACLDGKRFAHAIELLDETGILEIILPELIKLKKFPHGEHHPEGATPFEHTVEAVRLNTNPDYILNLSILFHDLGKGVTFKEREKNGKMIPTFYGHDEAGVSIIENICKRLRFTNAERECFVFVARNHMRFHKICEMKDSKVHALMVDKNFEILKQASYCDDFCRLHKCKKSEWNDKIKKLDRIENQEKARESVNKLVNGKTVLELCECKPGKIVGRIIAHVKAEVINKNITNEDEVKNLILNTYKRMK